MSQVFRHHFALPDSICYLNAASITPCATAVADAGIEAIERARRPWIDYQDGGLSPLERVRELTSLLIGANSTDMALVPSVSYGIATAAANVSVGAGSCVLTLEGDHPSAALVWQRTASEKGATLEAVARPIDGNWTRAILDRLADPLRPRVSVAVLAPVDWSDGAMIDLQCIAPRLRENGIALVIDATQAAGIMPLDVRTLQPDFLAFPAYKWLLGPYGCAFLYAHPKHHAGTTLDHHMNNRKSPNLTQRKAARDFAFLPGAQRFDRGERDDEVLLMRAVSGLELLHSMPAAERLAHVRMLTDRLAVNLGNLPVDYLPRIQRSPHIMGLQLRQRDAFSAVKALEQASVFTSARLGTLRVSPYLYNDENDIDNFVAKLRVILR